MTAVEWLDRWFRDNPEATHEEGNKALEQAKQMEKQQIEDAHIEGQRVFDTQPHSQWTNDQAEIYYNETYGSSEHIVDTNEMISSQTEISDEEIEEMLFHHSNEYAYGFKDAIQWYREQLEKRQ